MSTYRHCKPSWEALPAVAALAGHTMKYKGPKQIMQEVSKQPAFDGATYEVMGLQGVRLQNVGELA